MKKIFSLLIVAIFAVALMAAPAAAGYIESQAGALTGADLVAGDGGVDDLTVASEKIVAAYTLDFSGVGITNRAIIYSPSTDLASGSHIWIKLTNAEWHTTKNIYLVGFMGVGKTVVAQALAKRLDSEFLNKHVSTSTRN